MPAVLAQFERSLDELDPLVTAVRMAAGRDPAFSYTGIGAAIVSPAVAGFIVLLTGRFEHFLKEVVESAFKQTSAARPPVRRSQLSLELQLRMLKENITAASKETVFGKKRNVAARVSELDIVAKRIVGQEVWGDHAVQTSGNPGSETVKTLLQMVGVSQPDPWKQIEMEFSPRWQVQITKDAQSKSIPKAADELDSILVWRNVVAHSSSSLPIGERELLDAKAFMAALAASIEIVICSNTDGLIRAAGCAPATWP